MCLVLWEGYEMPAAAGWSPATLVRRDSGLRRNAPYCPASAKRFRLAAVLRRRIQVCLPVFLDLYTLGARSRMAMPFAVPKTVHAPSSRQTRIYRCRR